MNIKELIEIINIFNANVIYDNPRDVQYGILQGQSAFYFVAVEGKEQKKYKNSNDKSQFVSNTASIHIIDLNIDEIVDIFKCDGTGIYEFTRDIIKPFCNNNIDEDILYVMYVFLHEVGHWNQFLEMDRKVERFEKKDFQSYKDNFEEFQKIQKKIEIRRDKGNNCKITYNEKESLRKCGEDYRNIPKEKEADDFALKNMQKVIDEYKCKYK